MCSYLVDTTEKDRDYIFKYFLYGLTIGSNREIPGLLPATQPSVETSIVFGNLPQSWNLKTNRTTWYVSGLLDELGQPNLVVWKIELGFLFQYSDGIAFVVEESGKEVWGEWPDNMTLEDAVVYLLGPILGFALRLKGITCLHASAIAIDGQCVLFAGGQGVGKSTLAAAFAMRGYGVLSDDVTALAYEQGTFIAQPAYPRVRLWPGSVTELYGAANALPLLTPNWDKRYLDLSQTGYKFHNTPLKLGAIFVLGDHAGESALPQTSELSESAALVQLVANTYCGYMIGKLNRAEEFEFLSKMVSRVPSRLVRQGNGYADPRELCRVILKDVAECVS